MIEHLIGILPDYLYGIVIGYYALLFLLIRRMPEKAFRIFSLASLCLWAVTVLYLTVFIRVPVLEKRIHLIPFEASPYDMMYNAMLFLPWGSMVLGFWKTMKPSVGALLGIGASFLIELTQLATGRGICDIDDLISNAIGVISGIGIYMLLRRLSKVPAHHPSIGPTSRP